MANIRKIIGFCPQVLSLSLSVCLISTYVYMVMLSWSPLIKSFCGLLSVNQKAKLVLAVLFQEDHVCGNLKFSKTYKLRSFHRVAVTHSKTSS